MPYTPVGLFEDWSPSELEELRQSAREALIGGRIVNVSEPGTSYSKTYEMRAQDVLAEIKYAKESKQRTAAPHQTRPNFSGRGGYCGRNW